MDGSRRIGGVYVISVAAELVDVHPRTLRIYEAEGLVCPARTPTNIRLYSDADIARLRLARRLIEEKGVNVATVRVVMTLIDRGTIRVEDVEGMLDDDLDALIAAQQRS